jgi:hypothetical protein
MRQKGTWTPENRNLTEDEREAIGRRRMDNPNRSGWDRPDDNPSPDEVERYFVEDRRRSSRSRMDD